MDEKKSFVMYESWAILLAGLSEEDAGQIIKAICSEKTGIEYTIESQTAKAVYAMIAPQLEKDTEKYLAKCAKNKKIANEREKEKQERAKKNDTRQDSEHERSTNVQRTLNERATKTSRTSGDSDSESDSDSDIDSVSVSENESPTETKRKKRPTGAKKDAHKVRFPDDAELDQAFEAYAEMRRKIKAPMTANAERLTMKELEKLSNGDRDTMIAILNQSTQRSWRGVFPLKEDIPKVRGKPKTGEEREQQIFDDIDRWAAG